MEAPNLNNERVLRQLAKDRTVRSATTKNSLFWFIVCYFAHYLKYEFAPFHHEMIGTLQDKSKELIVTVAFRGSGKSTIISLIYILWSIIGQEERKYILLVGRTQEQARQLLRNIRTELENNELLRSDLGPFREEEDEWRNMSLVISNTGTRITAISVGQSIRGFRHGPHRPDLIVCDDVEDLESVKTQEGRDKTYDWYLNEVIPAGDLRTTRVVVVGNYLHNDSFTQRLREIVSLEPIERAYLHYPLLDNKENTLWPGKYPTKAHIEKEWKRINNKVVWHREYLLDTISTEEQVIRPEWVKYYDQVPADSSPEYQFTILGVDLAISQNDSADYTAIVVAKVFGYGPDMRIYILPQPVNERLTFMATFQRLKAMGKTLLTRKNDDCIFAVEEVGYQGALIEMLRESDFYLTEGIKTKSQDKRARLAVGSQYVQAGNVLFPKNGTELLIRQLTGFGTEKHDDLADAFAILMMGIMNNADDGPCVTLIRVGGPLMMSR